ncbi:asparagine synthase-related protein [Kitasatospora sp. NPDC001574]
MRGVHEALPGRVLRLASDGSAHQEPYWEPAEQLPDDGLVPPAGYAQELRSLLERATERRLPTGEAVAVLLSGGVDSSLVTALAARLHDRPVHTYSISFGDDLPNELGYSGLVARHCGTTHRVLTVSGTEVAARLADTVALLDSPVGDPLTVPNLMLAEAVSGDGITVSLNGEGGDPVFGGPKNLPMLVHEMHRDDPDPEARAEAYLRSYRKCYEDLPRLLTPEALRALAGEPQPRRFVAPYLRPGPMHTLLNQLLHCNLRTKGAHHILTKVERLTASQGVQGRSPLFDRHVVDHAFATPPTLKLRGTVEKWVLKEAVRDLLPGAVVDRPKSGMRVPVQQWLHGPLRERLAALPAPAPRHGPGAGETVLSAERIVVRYGQVAAVREVTLDLRAGEVTALMGRNGSGKSSLLWALQGSGPRQGGSVEVARAGGEPPKDPKRLPAAEARQLVGLVPQTPTDLLYLESVAQELAQSDREAASAEGPTARRILDRLAPGIPDGAHPRDLSEGQKLALVLAIQLAAAPRVVLLDEPTRGLDYHAKEALTGIVDALAAEGRTVVVSTHDVEFVAGAADRVVVMAEGEIVADGPTAEVIVASPTFAPQTAKILAPLPYLTTRQVAAALAPVEAAR